MTKDQVKSVQENVLAAIEAGRVKMRPRWQFVVQAGLLVAGVVLAALALLFVGSFILFMLHQNGTWFTPVFGGRGVKELFFALPVIFILVAIIFIILLQLMVRRYAFAYGRPVLYSIVGIAAFVALGSYLVAQSHIHEGLFRQARDENLPLAGGFYRTFGAPQVDRVTPGIIIETNDEGFDINDPRDQKFRVIITPETQLPTGSVFVVGDSVIVLGDRDDMIITAEGIRKIEPHEEMLHIHRSMMK
jgi:hypothetical protein